MASERPTFGVHMIDSIGSLEKLLNKLDYHSHKPGCLFFDVQVINPGPDASISIISLFVRPIKQVFLIDVLKLGEEAFTTTSRADNSLKLLLESHNAGKILFDVGPVSATLFNLYGIRLNNIKDIQVMRLATQHPHPHAQAQTHAASLETCIEEDARPPARAVALWKRVHSSVSQLCDPATGGSDAVFCERPLRHEILNYHLQNVLILPRLWDIYCETLCKPNNAFWRSMVFHTVRDRIRESMNPGSVGHADGGRWGWSREFIETSKAGWNEDIFLELQGIPMVDRCWLDPYFFCTVMVVVYLILGTSAFGAVER